MNTQGLDPALAIIIDRAPSAELDYRFIIDCLKKYKRPNMKIDHLVKIGALIRVKKGLFVLGERIAKKPYSLELLANKIYAPSYISLEWALQYYGLIPERVAEITSITTKRSKIFETPIGRFSYQQLCGPSYSIGIDLVTFTDYQQALIATKEKALADLLLVRRGRITSTKMIKEILFEDLRIEPEDLMGLDIERLDRIYEAKPHSAIKYFIDIVKKGFKNE